MKSNAQAARLQPVIPSRGAAGSIAGRRPLRIPAVARGNIESIAQIEQEFVRTRSRADRVGEFVNRLAGSSGFIVAHLCGLTGWICLNAEIIPTVSPFDPFPFSFLGVLVSLEAVFLTEFCPDDSEAAKLCAGKAEHWAHLNLQVGLLAEQEATKMLQLLTSISDRLGLKTSHDTDLKEMVEKTAVNHLAQELADNLERTRAAGESMHAK